jgi:uncharacterized protein YdeI (YjbR/CyaY-like superfamily)
MVEYPQVTVRSREQWRAWLCAHHDSERGVWLVRFKQGRGPYVPYEEVVLEALAFGWVDSQPRSLDQDRSQLLITRRRSGSRWSAANRRRIASLREQGLMTAAGEAVVARAQADGTWEALDAVEALQEPEDLRVALERTPGARAQWDEFPRSTRRAILEWILAAKRPDTRARRVTQTASDAAVGIRANQWRQPRATRTRSPRDGQG